MSGLVGLPNAGKSTFLAAVSAARPKIADYPFTTLHPQLGVVRLSAAEEFVLADIPGLIAGAHEGAGLGTRFLGHVERCAVLLHLVDGAAGDVVRAWRTVREELAAYGGGLAEKPELIGLNKLDAMTPQGGVCSAYGAGESLGPAGDAAIRRHWPRRSRNTPGTAADDPADRESQNRPRRPLQERQRETEMEGATNRRTRSSRRLVRP